MAHAERGGREASRTSGTGAARDCGQRAAEGLSARDYDPETYLPQACRPELREFLTWPARLASVTPIAASDAPLLELTRYDAENRAVIFIIDHSATPKSLTLTLPQAAQFTHAFSARGIPVSLKPHPDGALEITLPLKVTTAVVWSRQPAEVLKR